jgi:chromosome segregation ATPase
MTDSWEDGFDSWTPRRQEGSPDDTGVDLDREALLRLARELAEKRRTGREQPDEELEELKQSLRERAEAVAQRERELAELQRRLGNAKASKQKQEASSGREALVARERAGLERAQALQQRERDLQARIAELEAETARIAEREQELAARLAEAEARVTEASAEKELAVAERERLDEREHAARAVEKELASLRVELERQRGHVQTDAAPGAAAPAEGEREDELRRLEARLDARERELAVMRQGLDAEWNTLRDRERALRRREVAEVRQSFDVPLAPPSFSEGLAAFARERSR